MANKSLQGTNWSTSGDWSPAGLPGLSDEVMILDTARDILTGDQGGANKLNSLRIPPRYVGAFGSSGSPLMIASSLIEYKGRGGFYFEADLNAGSAYTTDEIRIDAADSAVKVEIGSHTGDAGAITRIIAMMGNILLKANINFSSSRVEALSGVSLTMVSGIAAALTTLIHKGATSKSDSAITTLDMLGGGEHTQDTAAIITANVYSGALIYNHTAGTTIRVYDGGTLILDGNTKTKTITNVWLYPGARMIPSKVDGVNILITNLYDLRR